MHIVDQYNSLFEKMIESKWTWIIMCGLIFLPLLIALGQQTNLWIEALAALLVGWYSAKMGVKIRDWINRCEFHEAPKKECESLWHDPRLP